MYVRMYKLRWVKPALFVFISRGIQFQVKIIIHSWRQMQISFERIFGVKLKILQKKKNTSLRILQNFMTIYVYPFFSPRLPVLGEFPGNRKKNMHTFGRMRIDEKKNELTTARQAQKMWSEKIARPKGQGNEEQGRTDRHSHSWQKDRGRTDMLNMKKNCCRRQTCLCHHSWERVMVLLSSRQIG